MAPALALLIAFAALARGAHDLWAAAAVHTAILALLTVRLAQASLRPDPLPARLFPSLAAVGAALALSYARASNPGESWTALLDWLVFLGAFALGATAFRDPESLASLAAWTAWLFPLEAAFCFRQRFGMGEFQGAGNFWFEQTPGTLVNANIAAAFFLLWTPVLAERAFAAWRRGRAQLLAWGAALAANLFCLASTMSTWGLVCLAAGLPLLASGRLKSLLRRRTRLIAAIAAAGAAVLAGVLVWKFTRVYDWNGNPLADAGHTRRLAWWLAGLAMFMQSPWTGVGLGNFPSAYPAFKASAGQNTLFSHSLPIELLAEAGLIGLLAVGALVSWVLYRAATSGDERRWPYAVGAAQFLLFSLISVGAEYLVNLLAFGLFLGIAAAPSLRAAWRLPLAAAAAAVGAALFALPSLWSPLAASRLTVSGRRLLETGEVDRAIEAFRTAEELDPRAWEPRHGLAAAFAARYEAGKRPEDLAAALENERRALERNKYSIALRRNLETLSAAQQAP